MLHCFSHSPSLTHFLVEVLPALQGCHQSVRLWLLRMYAHSSHFDKEPLITTVHTHYYLFTQPAVNCQRCLNAGASCWCSISLCIFCCNLIYLFPRKDLKNKCMRGFSQQLSSHILQKHIKGCTSPLKNMHLYLT